MLEKNDPRGADAAGSSAKLSGTRELEHIRVIGESYSDPAVVARDLDEFGRGRADSCRFDLIAGLAACCATHEIE